LSLEVRRFDTHEVPASIFNEARMRSTLRCLLTCTLCVLLPAIGHAGPLGDALRGMSRLQRSRGRVYGWVELS
jgi:hypothetical protein